MINQSSKSLLSRSDILIRRMKNQDIRYASQIHSAAFPRQTLSKEWITCNFKAFPRIRYYVAEYHQEVVGYIQWTEKSGFRKEVVLELEQIAVLPSCQNQGIGTALICHSLPLIQEELKQREAKIKHLLISTRTDNQAQKLYIKTLKAKSEVIIPDLFSSDEVLMISRNFPIV